MKKNLSKIGFYLLMAFAVVNLTVSCSSSDDDDDKPNGPTDDELTLNGSLSTERILLSGYTYKLNNAFNVKAGGNLVIQKGVIIEAQEASDDVDYIMIEQGGRITAEGTKDQPIVMTSKTKSPGSWGGVHICGKAPINLSGNTGKSEINENIPYGGTNPDDNSGILRYVRLEYTGYAFNEDKESNGLTMYGVGRGTTIEYVQTYKGADDGFEWFGGTVNAKYLVSTGSGDDSFDWTEGWIGKGQFWVAVQDADGDCLIEADNLSGNFDNTPVSYPTIANLTLIGNNSTDAKRGVRLRAGTYVKMYNALITGKAEAVTTETTQTEQSFKDGKSVIEYAHLTTIFKSSDASLALDSKEGNAINQTINFKNAYVGTVSGGKNLSSDSFFTLANYKGAVQESNDWTAGWTK